MANRFMPTESKGLFVGRQSEVEQFDRVLQGERPEWITHVPGPGGVGKTRLLERLREHAREQENVLVTEELVDFYKTANQAGFGLLQDIARQLGLQHFPSFQEERVRFHQFLATEPEPGERQDAANRVTEAFLRDYQELLRRGLRIVLLFDTCEEMHAIESWVLEMLLPRIEMAEKEVQRELVECEEGEEFPEIHYRTTVVIAGRKRLRFSPELYDQVLSMDLPPLTQEEVEEFFRKGGLGEEVVSDEALAQLYERNGGRPLYVALSFDWLKNEVGTVEELLTLEKPFGLQLVAWVLRLKEPEKRVILYTALAWRRMEPSLLGSLLQCSAEEARQMIEDLSRFSFIKYRPPTEQFSGSFQLHDEMRMLVLDYVWPQEGLLTRRALLPQIIAWYEDRIGERALLEGEKLPTDDEIRSLLAEWLFYQSQLDLEQGFVIQERLFRRASHFLDLAFCDMLNQEMQRDQFRGKLSVKQQDDLRFREGLVAFRREQYDIANGIWSSLARRPDLDENLRATSHMLLVELKCYTGQPDEALEHARQADQLYESLFEGLEDAERSRALEIERGQLYNNWGYAYRVKGNWTGALDYYERALGMPMRRKNLARTLNNIGYIYFWQGNLIQARTYIGRALRIRRNLDIAYELGLGYNTMGIIMEQSGRIDEAADLYRKAQLHFQAAPSERGQALVFLNLGRLNRLINDFDEALAYLQRAHELFASKADADHMIEVLNELACVYRQRGESGDWEESKALFKESLDLSEKLGNLFAQADNWEDISVLHYRWAKDARRLDKAGEAEEQAAIAREAAKKALQLAKEQGYSYLQAKAERTFGDLTFADGDYEQAFEHYFEACRLMAQARVEERWLAVAVQSRYEEMADRLQEHLQALPTAGEIRQHGERLLNRLKALEEGERAALQTVEEFLKASVDIASRDLLIID